MEQTKYVLEDCHSSAKVSENSKSPLVPVGTAKLRSMQIVQLLDSVVTRVCCEEDITGNKISIQETPEYHMKQNDDVKNDEETSNLKPSVTGVKRAAKAKIEMVECDAFCKYAGFCEVLFSSLVRTQLQKIQERFNETGNNCQNVPKCIADLANLSDSDDHGLDSTSQHSKGTMHEQIPKSESEVLRTKKEYFRSIEMHKCTGLSGINEGQITGVASDDNIVTVKFQIKSLNIFTCAFKKDTTILDVKEKVARILSNKSENFTFLLYENELEDWMPLDGLGIRPLHTLELEITSTDPNVELLTDNTEIYIPIVDIITVNVQQDDGCYKSINVEIENQNYSKEWLGGYWNRKTLIAYYHANTQTKYWQPEYQPDRNCRDTQTPYPPKTVGIDTQANKATQMWRSDYYVPCADDKIMVARPYKFGIQYPDYIIKQVIVIQSYVRGLITRRLMKKWKAYLAGCLNAQETEELNAIAEYNEEKRNLLLKQVFPSSRNDFYMLYTMLGKWVEKERKRLQATKTDEPKKANYVELLQKEIQMLKTIEKHKVACKREMLRKQEMLFLVETSKPKVFTDRMGKSTSMDTMDTQRAREFNEIYSTFIRTDLGAQERIDMLMTLRHLLQNYETIEWTQEIIVLIEQECDLLTVGLKDVDLVGLRKRIEQLFMELIHHPEINPEAAKYKKPNASKTIDTFYSCKRCCKLMPVSDFAIHTRLKRLAACSSCEWMKTVSHMRIDLSPYKRLLKLVRDSEMQRCCFSSECFLLQEMGMYYLVHVIWQGQSVISEQGEVSQLRLIRWCDEKDWGVGNSVLMTVEEAKVHRKVKKIYTFYSQVVIDKIKKKQFLAKFHFKALLNMNDKLKNGNIWDNVHTMAPILNNTKWDAILKDDNKLQM